MSERSIEALAAAITARVLATNGVRGMFPPRDPSGPDRSGTRSVRLVERGSALRITARLATDRSVAAAAVLAAVASAVDGVLGEQPYELAIEIAVIE